MLAITDPDHGQPRMPEPGVGCYKFPLLIRPAMGDRSCHARKQSFRIPDRTEIAPESAHCYNSYISKARDVTSIISSSVNRIISGITWLTTIKNKSNFLYFIVSSYIEVYFNAKRNFCSSKGGAVDLTPSGPDLFPFSPQQP
ncbi:hypothetical protein [Mesorhizobium sp.]|uniref:hypothetical protein n=1 Tax=Mesorhizobium sp. TaxID=1871066 RepID=UPI0025F320DE|nr:hypothetical protein [Mesorhizobium sp.]